MGCNHVYTPCGSTTTVIAKDTCCDLPDPILTLTSGLSSTDTSLGTSEISINDYIHLYSENALTINVSKTSTRNIAEFILDFTNLSTQQTTDFCNLVTNCVSVSLDVYTKAETDALLNTKQDTLTFDTSPTNLSTNPVTSGGLYNYFLNYFNYNTQDTDDITEGVTNLFMTPAEKSKLAGLADSEWTSTATVTHLITGTNNVSIGSTSDVSKLYVVGNGNTVATSALVIENSDNTSIASFADDTSIDLVDGALAINPSKETSIKTTKLLEDVWFGIESIVSNTVLADTTNVAIITTGLQPVTVTLPLASLSYDGANGRVITFKRPVTDITGYDVTITGNGVETIDNLTDVILSPGDAITIISDGTEWHIL